MKKTLLVLLLFIVPGVCFAENHYTETIDIINALSYNITVSSTEGKRIHIPLGERGLMRGVLRGEHIVAHVYKDEEIIGITTPYLVESTTKTDPHLLVIDNYNQLKK